VVNKISTEIKLHRAVEIMVFSVSSNTGMSVNAGAAEHWLGPAHSSLSMKSPSNQLLSAAKYFL